MKQRLKQFTKLIAICALLVLSSCEKDLYEEGIKQSNNVKIEQKTFQELLQNKKFNSAYQKIEKSRIAKKVSLQGKTQLEDKYNFTIVEQSPIKVITEESDGSITYIMLIERTISENLKFENLILNYKNDILDARIIKYTLSKEPEKEENHGGEILDIIATEMTNLEIDGKFCVPCVITYVLMCDDTGNGAWEHDHIATQYCIEHSNNLYVQTNVECGGAGETGGSAGGSADGGNTSGTGTTGGNSNTGVNGGGGSGTIGSGSTGGNSNTGTNGGSGAGTIPSIPTSPISPFGSHETIIDEPCNKLKALTDNADFQVELDYLKTQVNTRKESAVKMENKLNFEGEIEKKFTRVTSNNEFNVSVNYTPLLYGSAHNHTIDSQSIPSWADLLWLRDLNDYIYLPRNIGEAVHLIVVRNSQNETQPPILYALTIQDIIALNQQIHNDLQTVAQINNPLDKIERLLEDFGEKFANDQDVTADLEKKFLKVYHNYGINLFKFDEATNKWNKLKLQYPYNPNNPNATNKVISEPCNN